MRPIRLSVWTVREGSVLINESSIRLKTLSELLSMNGVLAHMRPDSVHSEEYDVISSRPVVIRGRCVS